MTAETPKTPLTDVNEQFLAMCKMLGDIINELHDVLDVSVVCYAAARCTNFDFNPELATFIRRQITWRIAVQMRAIRQIIESLGGSTKYTEEEKPPNADA